MLIFRYLFFLDRILKEFTRIQKKIKSIHACPAERGVILSKKRYLNINKKSIQSQDHPDYKKLTQNAPNNPL